jgi:hypothetical protein
MAVRQAIWAAVLWVALGLGLALGAPSLLPVKLGLRAGWLTAGTTGLTAFGLLFWSRGRSLKAALGAIAVGFLVRMALLAVGLVLALRSGAGAMWFTLAFFGTYLPLQALEIAGAVSGRKSDASPLVGVPR